MRQLLRLLSTDALVTLSCELRRIDARLPVALFGRTIVAVHAELLARYLADELDAPKSDDVRWPEVNCRGGRA